MDIRSYHLFKHYILVLGGLNLGIWAVFQIDVVQTLFGGSPLLVRFIYLLIGVSAVLDLMTHKANCKLCLKKK